MPRSRAIYFQAGQYSPEKGNKGRGLYFVLSSNHFLVKTGNCPHFGGIRGKAIYQRLVIMHGLISSPTPHPTQETDGMSPGVNQPPEVGIQKGVVELARVLVEVTGVTDKGRHEALPSRMDKFQLASHRRARSTEPNSTGSLTVNGKHWEGYRQ